MLHVDVSIESDDWLPTLPDIESLAHRVVQAAVKAVRTAPGHAEISVMLSDDANLRRLNRDYRGQDSATNVLAFGNNDLVKTPARGPAPDARPTLLGDVVIAFETVAREAADQKKPLTNHVSHLLVHGVLHLLGYDHEAAAAARDMEDLERAILAGLGIPDPYSESATNETPSATASGVAPHAQVQ